MPYIPNTDQNRQAMLKRIGVKSFDELIADIPAEIRLRAELKLPKALSEMEAVKEIKSLAGQNRPASSLISFLGGGAYDHYIPAAIDHILLRSEFYTAYTPYQAEVSQGTLQAIWEFQSLVTALTGMDAANASMYDGATALAEAGVLACNHTKRKQLVVARTVNPAYRQVLATYAGGAGIEVASSGGEIGFALAHGVQVDAVEPWREPLGAERDLHPRRSSHLVLHEFGRAGHALARDVRVGSSHDGSVLAWGILRHAGG